jgi:hypothetical protein
MRLGVEHFVFLAFAKVQRKGLLGVEELAPFAVLKGVFWEEGETVQGTPFVLDLMDEFRLKVLVFVHTVDNLHLILNSHHIML